MFTEIPSSGVDKGPRAPPPSAADKTRTRLNCTKFGQLILKKIKLLPPDFIFYSYNAPNSISAGALRWRSLQRSPDPDEYRPIWLGLRRGAFTCVGWQVTLWDPIQQVTLR